MRNLKLIFNRQLELIMCTCAIILDFDLFLAADRVVAVTIICCVVHTIYTATIRDQERSKTPCAERALCVL